MQQSPIYLTRRGAVIASSNSDRTELEHDFRFRHCVKLRGLLTTDLLEYLYERLAWSPFFHHEHEKIPSNSELCASDDVLLGLLHFLFNNEQLFGFVRAVTGCGPIGCFIGRVYRVVPGHGHSDAWHDDVGESRMAALSVNLGGEYTGSVLQIRDRRSRKIICECANTQLGDAILFRIAPGLEHRLTAIEGSRSKTAFAGWFCGQPCYLEAIRTVSSREGD